MLQNSRKRQSLPVMRRFRLVKAYAVTARVLLSYGIHALASRLGAGRWIASRRPDLHRKNARRVVRMILSLQGLFIKIGQLVSILTNFLPEDFRVELEGLQDRIPARPLDQIRTRIRSEFGADSEELFASFENVPVASASLAQVHEARLHDGRRVAVKVQHLNIEEVARLDLRTIRRIFAIVGRIVGVRGLDQAYAQLESVILEELDFAAEGRNLTQVAGNFAGYEGVSFPEVVPERSTRRVLTTTYVEGVKVTDLDGLRCYGVDRRRLAERVVHAYAQMIFVDGFYHADPHPGNVIVRPNGDIVFIDFGAVARLSPEMKDGIPRLLMGIVLRDRVRIGEAFRQMGIVAQEGHQRTLDELVDHLQEHFFDELSADSFALRDVNLRSIMETKMEALPDFLQRGMSVRDLTETFQVPRDWILLERTSLLLLGLCTHLDPTMNPLKTLRPYLERIVLGIEDDWVAVVVNLFSDVAVAVVTVFQEVDKFVKRLRSNV
ncbi:MAG TPA: AarF/UbiB family protein [Rhodothermales bacterium]|nr:AarF/UbiB family protein [Rhodothermales bacterium]